MGRAAKNRRQLPTRQVHRPLTLGVDIGGVLVDRVAEGSDTSFFGSDPMATPMVPGSLECIRSLVVLLDYRVHIVSKAGPKIAELSRRWMGRHGFTGEGGIPVGQVHFVRKRHEKHAVCEDVGITHFIDDRLDVLESLLTVERRYLFTGGLGANPQPPAVRDDIFIVDSWPRLVSLIRRDLDEV